MNSEGTTTDIQKIAKELEAQRGTLAAVIGLLMNLSNAVNEGFEKVNERLAALEGKQGMQGVNTQLQEIRHELHKIQKAYPYDDIFSNMQEITKGQA